MQPVKRVTAGLLFVGGIQVILSSEAHAYIDAGSGAFILQFVLAGAFGAAFALKMYWRRLKSALFKTSQPGSEPEGKRAEE